MNVTPNYMLRRNQSVINEKQRYTISFADVSRFIHIIIRTVWIKKILPIKKLVLRERVISPNDWLVVTDKVAAWTTGHVLTELLINTYVTVSWSVRKLKKILLC